MTDLNIVELTAQIVEEDWVDSGWLIAWVILDDCYVSLQFQESVFAFTVLGLLFVQEVDPSVGFFGCEVTDELSRLTFEFRLNEIISIRISNESAVDIRHLVSEEPAIAFRVIWIGISIVKCNTCILLRRERPCQWLQLVVAWMAQELIWAWYIGKSRIVLWESWLHAEVFPDVEALKVVLFLFSVFLCELGISNILQRNRLVQAKVQPKLLDWQMKTREDDSSWFLIKDRVLRIIGIEEMLREMDLFQFILFEVENENGWSLFRSKSFTKVFFIQELLILPVFLLLLFFLLVSILLILFLFFLLFLLRVLEEWLITRNLWLLAYKDHLFAISTPRCSTKNCVIIDHLDLLSDLQRAHKPSGCIPNFNENVFLVGGAFPESNGCLAIVGIGCLKYDRPRLSRHWQVIQWDHRFVWCVNQKRQWRCQILISFQICGLHLEFDLKHIWISVQFWNWGTRITNHILL